MTSDVVDRDPKCLHPAHRSCESRPSESHILKRYLQNVDELVDGDLTDANLVGHEEKKSSRDAFHRLDEVRDRDPRCV